MPMLPYPLARPFLFGLDPETAHDVALKVLARTHGTPLQWSWSSARVEDPVTVAGLRFPNRIGLAAGLDKNARCIDALGAMGFGFVEVGTVTPLPQAGNPKPRLFRLPAAQALINRLGLNNDGIESFVANIRQASFRDSARGRDPMLLGLNIGKNAATPMADAAQDYLACLDGVYPHADYVTINISSPNTKGLRDLQGDDALNALLQLLSQRREQLAQQHGRRVPFFLKIAPDLDESQIDSIAGTLRRFADADAGGSALGWGVVATNTTVSRTAVAGMPHAEEQGGLSGAPVLEASNRVIRRLRDVLGAGFPIIGVGGVLSGADAAAKVAAGADVVQIYTGLIYRGPALVREAALAIQRAA